jgi:hypothetical protein
MAETNGNEPIRNEPARLSIEDDMRQSYLDYAMSVNSWRALPDGAECWSGVLSGSSLKVTAASSPALKAPKHISPGQRPGFERNFFERALKGREESSAPNRLPGTWFTWSLAPETANRCCRRHCVSRYAHMRQEFCAS